MANSNIYSWSYDELIAEVIRLRAISETQSKHLAQALYEKNHRNKTVDEAEIDRLHKLVYKVRTEYAVLLDHHQQTEECHKADAALLEQLKNDFKKVLNR